MAHGDAPPESRVCHHRAHECCGVAGSAPRLHGAGCVRLAKSHPLCEEAHQVCGQAIVSKPLAKLRRENGRADGKQRLGGVTRGRGGTRHAQQRACASGAHNSLLFVRVCQQRLAQLLRRGHEGTPKQRPRFTQGGYDRFVAHTHAEFNAAVASSSCARGQGGDFYV